ncbi:MAG: response regulator [Candidatus Hodarchaeales archaeon]|jgi:CheY-like chemotaxis protein
MNSSKKRILIVDDEPDTLELMETILGHEGYEIIKALTGTEALELIDEKIDLVLLDVRMPDLDGIEVCKQLKSDPKRKEIPIIIFSAKTLDHHIQEGLKAGANEYITKPFSSSHLLGTLRKYI